jgi:hypothetical protein
MKRTGLAIIGFMIIMAAISGCQNIFSGKPKAGSAKPEVNSSIPEGYGSVRVNFALNSARTALPEIPEFGKIDFIFLNQVESAEPKDYSYTIDPKETGVEDCQFLLRPGTYMLRIEAFIDGKTDAVAEGWAGEILIKGGHEEQVNIILYPITDGSGTGTLNIKVKWPSGFDFEFDDFTLYELTSQGGPKPGGIDVRVSANDRDGDYTVKNIEAETGFYLLKLRIDGTSAGRNEVVHIGRNLTTTVSWEFTDADFVSYFIVTSDQDDGPGSLRDVLWQAAARPESIIKVMLPPGSEIVLDTQLEIDSSVTIEGNGITITRNPNNKMRLMFIHRDNAGAVPDVKIGRVHFKGGLLDSGGSNEGGGAIFNMSGNLTLESCIFSDNEYNDNGELGGAIKNGSQSLTVYGCTFYRNRALGSVYGGAAIGSDANGTVTLIGNLFYGNTSSNGISVFYGTNGTGNFNYNVFETESFGKLGWDPDSGDNYMGNTPIESGTFKHYTNSEAFIITALPSDYYPAQDFYGKGITTPAAAGAVQAMISPARYSVKNGTHLEKIGVNNDYPLSAYYVLTDSTSITGIDSWEPIGTDTDPFIGTFDGGGHIIDFNIQYNSSVPESIGLFGYIEGGRVKNLQLTGTIVISNTAAISSIDYAGAVAGKIYNSATVENIDSSVQFTSITVDILNVGGIAGSNDSSTIENCYYWNNGQDIISFTTSGNIIMAATAGGIVGNTVDGTIRYCWASGRLIGYGASFVGGIVGRVNTNTAITHCVVTIMQISNGNVGNTIEEPSDGRIWGGGIPGSPGTGNASNNYAHSTTVNGVSNSGTHENNNGGNITTIDRTWWMSTSGWTIEEQGKGTETSPWMWIDVNPCPNLWFQ